MAHPAYSEWRGRANAYLVHHVGVTRWCTAEVLGMLRHTLAGQRLWNEARDCSFFERHASGQMAALGAV